MYECQFCKQNFASRSSLNLHIKTAKYCLNLQSKIVEERFVCDACNKTFCLNYNFAHHQLKCKELIKKNEIDDKNKLINNLEEQNTTIKKLENDICTVKQDLETQKNENKILEVKLLESNKIFKKYDEQIEKYNEQIVDYKLQLEKYQLQIDKYENKIKKLENDLEFSTREIINCKIDSEDTLKQIIKKNSEEKKQELDTVCTLTKTFEKVITRTTNINSHSNNKSITNNVITQNINLSFPLDLSEESLSKKKVYITENDVRNKQKGMVSWFLEKVAKNENGEIGLICTDKNRHNFQYLTEKGTLVNDIGGNIIMESMNLHVKSHIYKILNAIAEGDKKVYEQYNHGNLFDKKFALNLAFQVYTKTDLDLLQNNNDIKQKRKIMRDTGMSEEEYNRIVLKK